jgi:hypothetical protein
MIMSNLWLSVLDAVRKPLFYAVRGLTGTLITVPVEYVDGRQIEVHLPVATEAIRDLLPNQKLHPVEHAPGQAIIAVTANEFRRLKTSSPYNELAIAIPAIYDPDGEALPGVYLLYLPVSTEMARWYGVDALGLPKFLASIEFEDSADAVCCYLRAGSKEILRLEVPSLPTQQEEWHMHVFGLLDNRLVQTPWHTTGLRGMADGKAVQAQFALGDHPIADALRELGIGSQPISSFYVPAMRNTLGKPVFLTDAAR